MPLRHLITLRGDYFHAELQEMAARLQIAAIPADFCDSAARLASFAQNILAIRPCDYSVRFKPLAIATAIACLTKRPSLRPLAAAAATVQRTRTPHTAVPECGQLLAVAAAVQRTRTPRMAMPECGQPLAAAAAVQRARTLRTAVPDLPLPLRLLVPVAIAVARLGGRTRVFTSCGTFLGTARREAFGAGASHKCGTSCRLVCPDRRTRGVARTSADTRAQMLLESVGLKMALVGIQDAGSLLCTFSRTKAACASCWRPPVPAVGGGRRLCQLLAAGGAVHRASTSHCRQIRSSCQASV